MIPFTRKIPLPENPDRDYSRNIQFSLIFLPRQLTLIVSYSRQQIFFTFCVFTVPPGGLFWQLNKKTNNIIQTAVLKPTYSENLTSFAAFLATLECQYLCKYCFLVVISNLEGSMHSRAVPKVILHWFISKLTSESIKCGGGIKIWFHGWLRLKKSIT